MEPSDSDFSIPEPREDYNHYFFRVPFVSSIYPHPSPDETFSVLQASNESRPVHKRFPMEILLLINSKVHENSFYESVRSIWTPVTTNYNWSGGVWADETAFHKDRKTYHISEESDFMERLTQYFQEDSIYFWKSVSAADLLYRVRCFFPEVNVNPTGSRGYKSIWHAGVRHNETGVILSFSEFKAAAQVHPVLVSGQSTPMKLAGRAFITDAERLLNTLFKSIDEKRFAYYHPAADADLPTVDERFLAVPELSRDRVEGIALAADPDASPYAWQPVAISAADISSFNSLLPELKYNIEFRKVDAVHGTADLTTIISSSLLFYRLLCHFVWRHNNADDAHPITSVWQIKLKHTTKDVSVIFMDDRGLFDIRVEGEGAGDAMRDLVALVNELCSDHYAHPYDGTVAGCVA